VTDTPQRAVIYVRMSNDKAGEALGVARQEADARQLAERLEWGVAEVAVENDTSAFKRKRIKRPNGRTELRVVRPEFRRVLDLLDSGACDGLIAYDLDRTARDPRDLEDLIDVVEDRIPRIPVRSVTGSLRLDNDADVTMARVMVAVANKSSRDTQRRVKRKMDELAAAGQYAGGGARRFGYERDGMTILEPERAVILEAVDRVLAGESLRAIGKDFDARGIRPVKAAQWSTVTLSGILKSARIAGLREHRGEIVGAAAWPAIIDRDTRDQLLAQLELNSHGRGKAALRYWCGQILWCGRCEQPLSGSQGNGRRGHYRYWCATNRPTIPGCGKIGVSGPGVEAWVETEVMTYLARPDVVQALTDGTSKVATDETRRLLDEDERSLRELARMHGHREISLAEWLEARAPVEARAKVYREALKRVVPAQVRGVLEAPDPAVAWRALDAASKRDLVRVLLGSGGYKGWTVAPADLTKPRRFDPDRLTLAEADVDEVA
jgi:site-specific DNA recombinase